MKRVANILCLLKAGRRLLDIDPKYLVHDDHLKRIRARYAIVAERSKGRVA